MSLLVIVDALIFFSPPFYYGVLMTLRVCGGDESPLFFVRFMCTSSPSLRTVFKSLCKPLIKNLRFFHETVIHECTDTFFIRSTPVKSFEELSRYLKW